MNDAREQLKRLQTTLPAIGFKSNGKSIIQRFTNGMMAFRQYIGHGGELWLKVVYLNKDITEVDVLMPMSLNRQALAQLWAGAHPILSNDEHPSSTH